MLEGMELPMDYRILKLQNFRMKGKVSSAIAVTKSNGRPSEAQGVNSNLGVLPIDPVHDSLVC